MSPRLSLLALVAAVLILSSQAQSVSLSNSLKVASGRAAAPCSRDFISCVSSEIQKLELGVDLRPVFQLLYTVPICEDAVEQAKALVETLVPAEQVEKVLEVFSICQF